MDILSKLISKKSWKFLFDSPKEILGPLYSSCMGKGFPLPKELAKNFRMRLAKVLGESGRAYVKSKTGKDNYITAEIARIDSEIENREKELKNSSNTKAIWQKMDELIAKGEKKKVKELFKQMNENHDKLDAFKANDQKLQDLNKLKKDFQDFEINMYSFFMSFFYIYAEEKSGKDLIKHLSDLNVKLGEINDVLEEQGVIKSYERGFRINMADFIDLLYSFDRGEYDKELKEDRYKSKLGKVLFRRARGFSLKKTKNPFSKHITDVEENMVDYFFEEFVACETFWRNVTRLAENLTDNIMKIHFNTLKDKKLQQILEKLKEQGPVAMKNFSTALEKESPFTADLIRSAIYMK